MPTANNCLNIHKINSTTVVRRDGDQLNKTYIRFGPNFRQTRSRSKTHESQLTVSLPRGRFIGAFLPWMIHQAKSSFIARLLLQYHPFCLLTQSCNKQISESNIVLKTITTIVTTIKITTTITSSLQEVVVSKV
jgi:hypothetical protein